MRARDVNHRIERLGGEVLRQRGSHRVYRAVCADGTWVQTVVPQHAGRDIAPGTVRAIEKDLEPAFGSGWLK
jgi:predicted RNA binding protein YcfA (HicA-like mRNA interferase family)